MAKTKFTDFGNVIGRGKTHRTSGQLMSGKFSRKGGEGPLVKQRHENSAQLKPVSPTMTRKVIQNSATVFSLTGGYYPTFTQSFNDMKTWYDNYRTGYTIVNESFNDKGPAGVILRGNHTWYKYPTDYMSVLESIPKDIDIHPNFLGDGTADLQDNNVSLIDEIFDVYQKWISGGGESAEMMDTWRKQVVGKITESAEPFLKGEDSAELQTSFKQKQAPEEIIPELLMKMYPDLDIEAADELMETYGQANPVDIVFRFMGQVYAKDVTQSRIMEKGTHTSIGKFKPETDSLAKAFQKNPDYSGLMKDLLKHFKESRKTINLALKSIHEMFVAYKKDKRGVSLREFVGDRKSDHYIKSRMGGKVSTQRMMEQGSTSAAELAKREGVMEAVDAALHIIGMQWSNYEGGRLDTGGEVGYSDLFVLSNEHPINVGINWRLSKRSRGKLWVLRPVGIADIVINPEATFYMDHFLQTIELTHNINREVVLQVTNMLWNANNMYMTEAEMVMGVVQEMGISQVGDSGYIVAGGAVVFEPTDVNDAIGSFLTEVMGNTDEALRNMPQVNEVFQKAKDGGRNFHELVQNIPDPVALEQIQPDMENFELGNYLSELTDMNNLLKASSWAAPYVGIMYQGGQKSGIWPILSGK
jgi:hypothetical protein